MSIVQLVYVLRVANRKSYKDDGSGGSGDDAFEAADAAGRFGADRNVERTHPLMLISCSGIYAYKLTHSLIHAKTSSYRQKHTNTKEITST